MTLLVLGLVVFLGTHSVRIFADGWRSAQVARLGLNAWKALYSIVSIAGFAMIVVGFGQARALDAASVVPPVWMRHVAALVTLAAFVLLAAAYVPRNRIRAAVGHPMVAGVKAWAIAHLLANWRAVDLLLFGAFLAWAVLDYRAARARDRATQAARPRGTLAGDAVTVVVGVAAWVAFAMFLHVRLIGVAPFAHP